MIQTICWLLAVSIATGSAYDFNATVERMILDQKVNWCSARKFHGVQLRDQDDRFFDEVCQRNYTSYGDERVSHRRYKRQAVMRRMEYRCMTTAQRTNYHAALQRMKSTMAGGLTEYDNFVVRHDGRVARSAHFGPSFAPWHREYIMTLERAVRRYCPTCMVPYWDSRLDKRLGGNPAHSAMFSPHTFGNAVGPVTTGFAANWLSASPECVRIGRTLRRNMNPTASSFYDDWDVNFADGAPDHRSISFPWANRLEFSHGYVHTAFGRDSHMGDIMCSPSDPIFISHHTFIDYVFERARTNMKRRNNLRYVNTDASNLPPGFDDSDNHIKVTCAANSPMWPFPNLVNSFGLLSEVYTTQLYNYERTPGDVQCMADAHCCSNGNTEYLWCDRIRRQCVSKVQENGQINPRYPVNACHCSQGRRPSIIGGFCRCA